MEMLISTAAAFCQWLFIIANNTRQGRKYNQINVAE